MAPPFKPLSKIVFEHPARATPVRRSGSAAGEIVPPTLEHGRVMDLQEVAHPVTPHAVLHPLTLAPFIILSPAPSIPHPGSPPYPFTTRLRPHTGLLQPLMPRPHKPLFPRTLFPHLSPSRLLTHPVVAHPLVLRPQLLLMMLIGPASQQPLPMALTNLPVG